ncbi:MAG: GNAT family N-acetyltransferase, partial [Clostridiales bacterium]|nr:GNAT family N-acetyltransferase [Clostridiales bacterium]
MQHLGTKVLQTPRLTLRPFTIHDADAMYRNWASDSAVTRFLSWKPHESVEETRLLLAQWQEEAKNPANYNWAVVFHDGEKDILVGNISLLKVDDYQERAMFGYCMAKKYWG